MCDKPVDELTVMKENVCKKSKGNKSARRLGGPTDRQKKTKRRARKRVRTLDSAALPSPRLPSLGRNLGLNSCSDSFSLEDHA